jgi:hypothetical protein
MKDLCLCGHVASKHDDGAACTACNCVYFAVDLEAMKDQEDQAKILCDDVRRGK